MDRVYRSNLTKLDIPERVLRDMLLTCTKEAPFLSHRGELFRQVDGVAMGSPLGVLFANMYMAQVEERAFNNSPPTGIYARYIDDIFISIMSDEEVPNMIAALEGNSSLAFTCERSIEQRLPFLDVDISKQDQEFKTKVYTKATNVGRCLNARGECPVAYKISVISSYVNRALTHCSNWTEIHRELERVRQLLTNNGYADHLIEKVIKKKLEQYAEPTQLPTPNKEKITIYHQNTFHDRYREECDALKNIIKRGVTPTDHNTIIDLRIYCKPNLTSSLIMRNSTAPRTQKEAITNVVYKFSCQEGRCDGSKTYIGRTSSTLRRRLQSHRNQGSIFQHFTETHNMKPPLEKLIEHTEIVHKETAFRKLQIAEAVSITCQHPTINIQQTADFILPSARPQQTNQHQEQHAPRQQQHQEQQPQEQPVQPANQRPGPVTRAAANQARTSRQPPGSHPQPNSQ